MPKATREIAVDGPSEQPGELLERSRHLATLGEALADVVRTSRGRLVFVGGEAGVGKTALLRRFCDDHRSKTRIMWGACDPLFTPSPLGPLVDVAEITGGELQELVRRGARPHEVAPVLMRELGNIAPCILVFEDVHWGDEATLDVLRLLGHRAATFPAFVLASYRDDELDRTHPLRVVLGDLATDKSIGRIKLESLSSQAVAMLAEPHDVDPDELYRKTAGNPFFVTEVLAAAGEQIPQTVRDAVLARTARLGKGARLLLETVAVVPPQAELWLLERVTEGAVQDLEECLASGILTPATAGVSFRHELARLAVEESLPPDRRLDLHRRALAALADPPSAAPDLARLAHHAEAAGDAEAVLRFAPAAGERAASLGAHREAAAQYARALRFADRMPLDWRAELLERRFNECFLSEQGDEAIEAIERAVEDYRTLGNSRKEAVALLSLSRVLWCPGRNVEGNAACIEAVRLLEGLPPGRELANAYGTVASLFMNEEDAAGTLEWGTRALELADRLGDTEMLVRSLNDVGTMEALIDQPAGREKLERSLELAREGGFEGHAGRAFAHLAWIDTRQRSFALAERHIDEGIEYGRERGLDLSVFYLFAYRSRAELDRGRWDDAADCAVYVLRHPTSSTLLRIIPLTVLGLVRARRGDPDQWTPLDEAFALAVPSGELQRIGPAAAARAEAAWLEGRVDAVAEATEDALALAISRRASWVIGELAYWRWRAGIREEIPTGAAEPYAVQMAGDWKRAAELWNTIGCPYEAALALGDADDEDSRRRGLEELHRLGARPAANILARSMRLSGARKLPRGPRPATQENPANLTGRELDVLRLLAEGARNADIAQRLVLSEKTVHHHVSAILRKLGVRTRGEAAAEASRLGLTAQDR